VIHQLEQVSSDEHVGSLAENALEALRSHDKVIATTVLGTTAARHSLDFRIYLVFVFCRFGRK